MPKMILRIAILAAFSASVLSCGAMTDRYPGAEVTQTEAGNTLIVAEDFTAVLLTKEYMDAKLPQTPPSGYWTPEVDQVLELESKLEEYLSHNRAVFNSGNAPSGEDLSSYRRQYIGVTNKEGSLLVGSFFCSRFSENQDWQEQLISVMGGGDCFFKVWWDPNSREFTGMHVNSPE